MSETEKLQQTITEFETEVAQLETDIATLEQQLATATTTAETAVATAERRADKASQKAAVDAEQERARLTTALGRKRLALTAATADLQTARHGLTASQKAAEIVRLQAQLDELTVVAAAVDAEPTNLNAWVELKQRADEAQRVYRRAGGKGSLLNDVRNMAVRLMEAQSRSVDWALQQGDRPSPIEIPTMAELLRVQRAQGLARELAPN